MAQRNRANVDAKSSALLLELAESDKFNVHLAVSYLKTYSHSIGITYYLVNKLAQFPEEEVEFYWPQICHLLITRASESGALEGFIVKKCEESIHLVMLTLWQLQASLSDLSSTPNTPSFATCRRVYNRVQHIIFADPLAESSSEAWAERERVGTSLLPAIAGMGILAASWALPLLSTFNGKMAIEEGKRSKVAHGVWHRGKTLHGSSNAGNDNSESEDEIHALDRSPSIDNASDPMQRFRQSAENVRTRVSKATGHASKALPPVSSFKSSRSKRNGQAPSYIPGAPIPLVKEGFAHSPRTPVSATSVASKRKHVIPTDVKHLGFSQSTTSLPSPTLGHFNPLPEGEIANTAGQNTSPTVTFTSASDTKISTKAASPSLTSASPKNDNVARFASHPPRVSRSGTPIDNRGNRVVSSPSFHPYASMSSLPMSQSLSNLSQNIPQDSMKALLRSYACRSQLDLLTSLQDIANRLIVVPKMARLSSLRAELTILNHGLPRGCCLCLGCSGKGLGSVPEAETQPPERAQDTTSSSIYTTPLSKQQYRPHHRIVRISPSESVVLNSADRAPFLIHVEVLEDDLDFDPSRRQNAEDVRSVMGERDGTYKIHSHTPGNKSDAFSVSPRTSAPGTPRSRSQEGINGLLSPNVSLSRSPSQRSIKQPESYFGLPNGVSSVDETVSTDLQAHNPTESKEEVDLVEQLYGSFSVHDAAAIELPDFHPEIHNRSIDEETWKRAEARKSISLSPSASANKTAKEVSKSSPRKNLTIDEYAERMRMAAIMLAQLNASQQLPMTGTDAVTGVVGAGVGIGVNLTYGVGSVVGSVVGVGMDAVRASFGGRREDTVPTSAIDGAAVASDQAASGVSATIDPTSAASGLSSVSGTLNPATLPIGPGSQRPLPSPTNPLHVQQARQRVLNPTEAKAIRDRIMDEMMGLEEERMARMRASSGNKGRWSTNGQQDNQTKEEESIIMRAVNKEDPSGAVFQESWSEKKSRIRAASPFGHLATWDVFSVIVKTGADLRQEQLAVQLIKEFGRIWTETKCSHWVRYFRILVTSESTGLIETITDAVSVHSIKKEAYAKLAASNPGNAGYLPSYTLYDYFLETYGQPSSASYRKAQDAFMKSLASYSIISYLLQIKDRHNGNILIDKTGHVIHIDFGFLLSNSPGSLGAERAPFKLTQDYIDILGGMGSPKFDEFRTLLKKLFRDIRLHAERLIAMVELMQSDSKLPCFSSGEATSQNLRDRFQLSLSANQADDYVDRLVIYSAGSVYTRLYDTFQRHSQGVL